MGRVTVYCSECDYEMGWKDTKTKLKDGKVICRKCYNKLATRCVTCGDNYLTEDLIAYKNKHICKACLEKLYNIHLNLKRGAK